MAKNIVLIATLDTKGAEAEYVKKLIQKRGHNVLLVDDGIMGKPASSADITREETAAAANTTLDELIALGAEGAASRAMAAGVVQVVNRLYNSGKLDGVISMGGGVGSSMGAAGMRELPVGVPKLLVSTQAGQRRSEGYVGTKDVTLMPSVCDIEGLNRLTRKILANAAGAIVGMVELADEVEVTEAPLVVMSEVGNTTACGLRVKSALEEKGYEVVIFGGSGIGGKCQEEFIKNNPVVGVIELSIYEVTNELFGGVATSGPHRLEAAGQKGIPQIITPGYVNALAFIGPETIPERFKGHYQIVRQPQACGVFLNADELQLVARTVAEKLNRATGPVRVLIPTRGFSSYRTKERQFYDPYTERAFTDALKELLNPSIRVQEIDAHINDSEFADTVVENFLQFFD